MQTFRKSLSALFLLTIFLAGCAAPAADAAANVDQSASVIEAQAESGSEDITAGEANEPAEVEEAVEEVSEIDAEAAETEAAEVDEDFQAAAAENEGVPAAENGAAEDKINLYISPDSLGLALEEAFEAEHGDVLTVVGGPWCRKVKSEQEAGDIQADVICGAEPVFYDGLAESGALLSYTSPNVASLKTELQWDNGFYVPASLSYIGIVYNKTLVDETSLPATFSGLNDPQWDALTAVPDASQCASSLAIAAAFSQPDLDMSFYEGAKANHALLSDRAGKLPEMVASGEAALGVGPHDPVVRLQKKAKKEGVESPVSITWAEEGAFAIPRPVAIIADENRSEGETEIAMAFVDFILSEQGQVIFVKNAGYVPAADGIEGPALVPSDVELLPIDWDWAMQNSVEVQQAFQAVMYGGN